MKTPQQIKKEVEKEIEELKEEAEKELIIYKEEKDFFERRKQYSSLQNIIIKLREREAKLSILTEYDKSIKEMIENFREEIKEIDREEFYNKDCFKRVLFKIDKYLSKIGDVQQSKEKREDE